MLAIPQGFLNLRGANLGIFKMSHVPPNIPPHSSKPGRTLAWPSVVPRQDHNFTEPQFLHQQNGHQNSCCLEWDCSGKVQRRNKVQSLPGHTGKASRSPPPSCFNATPCWPFRASSPSWKPINTPGPTELQKHCHCTQLSTGFLLLEAIL